MKILKPTLLTTVLAMCLTLILSCAHKDDKMMDEGHNKMESTMMTDSQNMKNDTPMSMDKPMQDGMHKEMQGTMDMSGKGDMKKTMEKEKMMME